MWHLRLQHVPICLVKVQIWFNKYGLGPRWYNSATLWATLWGARASWLVCSWLALTQYDEVTMIASLWTGSISPDSLTNNFCPLTPALQTRLALKSFLNTMFPSNVSLTLLRNSHHGQSLFCARAHVPIWWTRTLPFRKVTLLAGGSRVSGWTHISSPTYLAAGGLSGDSALCPQKPSLQAPTLGRAAHTVPPSRSSLPRD